MNTKRISRPVRQHLTIHMHSPNKKYSIIFSHLVQFDCTILWRYRVQNSCNSLNSPPTDVNVRYKLFILVYLWGKPIAKFQYWGIKAKIRMMDGKNSQTEVNKRAIALWHTPWSHDTIHVIKSYWCWNSSLGVVTTEWPGQPRNWSSNNSRIFLGGLFSFISKTWWMEGMGVLSKEKLKLSTLIHLVSNSRINFHGAVLS